MTTLRFHNTLKAAFRRAVKEGKAEEFADVWRAVHGAQTANELRDALARARRLPLVEDRVIRDFETLDPTVYLEPLVEWERTSK